MNNNNFYLYSNQGQIKQITTKSKFVVQVKANNARS